MTSKQIYALVGALVLIVAVIWWGSGRDAAQDVREGANQEETGATPTNRTTTSVNPTVVPQKPVPTIPTAKSLAGSTFRLATYNGVALPSGTKFTLTFTEESFTLKLCNSLSSNYYIDNNIIKVSNLAGTLMYCSSPSNIMKMESDFSYMLNSGQATIYRSGSTLILSHKSGIVMAFEGF